MQWKHPPIIKIYEALGAVADERVHVSANSAKVYSSSGNKFYTVDYDPNARAIMVNDNGSFYKGYLGYPAIAFLMLAGEIPYSSKVAEYLKDIPWKDINQKFKNDFDKTLEFILKDMSEIQRAEITDEVKVIDTHLANQSYNLLGIKVPPPEGY